MSDPSEGSTSDDAGGQQLLAILAEAARTGRGVRRAEVEQCRQLGADAAAAGLPVRDVIERQLAAARRAFGGLPGVADAATASEVRVATQALLGALHRVLDAVFDGYDEAQHAVARDHDLARQDFIEALLAGRGDPVRLAEAGQRFGMLLAGRHLVALVRARQAFTQADPVLRAVEQALVRRFGHHNVLVAIRDGLLVCVLPSTLRGGPGELAHQLLTSFGTETGWQIGVGRPHSGPGGVGRSFEEAHNALHLADKLGLRAPILHADDLLVFPVLLRDQAAINDLVRTVLGPLTTARGGAQPMIDTLAALFDSHGSTTAAARRLNLSARTVSYRLDRIKNLTGYTPADATQRFTLEAAVLAARLLDWPTVPLPDE